MSRRVSAWAVMLVLLAGFAFVARAADFSIEQPWARATIGQTPNAVAYLTVVNRGAKGDRLIGVRTPAARHASLHTHSMAGGMMRMEAVPAIDVPVGATVELAPGGLHVMLMGLHEPLREGANITLTLTFERNGDLEFEVPVLAPASMGPKGAAGHGGAMKHDGMKMK